MSQSCNTRLYRTGDPLYDTQEFMHNKVVNMV